MSDTMIVKFSQRIFDGRTGQIAEAEIHFQGGMFDGLKLIGFGVWERRHGGRNVTFPARAYVVGGERRSFALLRPAGLGVGLDDAGQRRVRDFILAEYEAFEAKQAEVTA